MRPFEELLDEVIAELRPNEPDLEAFDEAVRLIKDTPNQ